MAWTQDKNSFGERTWTNGDFQITETEGGYDLYEDESYCNSYETLAEAREKVDNLF